MKTSTQDEVLLRARRRCCICFGLNRDTRLKAGQIAHLDHDNANGQTDNLAYLCLDHHDEYDSRTSQRKGLTIGEVKAFRVELHGALDKLLNLDVRFGDLDISAQELMSIRAPTGLILMTAPYTGRYIRVGDVNSSAEITVTPVHGSTASGQEYKIKGISLHGTNRRLGPNIGTISFKGTVTDDVIEYKRQHQGSDEIHLTRLTFQDETLIVHEENLPGVYGMGAHFVGEYRLTKSATLP